MIKITQSMRDAHAIRLAEVEKEVDRQIENAICANRNHAYFACDYDRDADVYDEIRAKYERAGYRIKPTGYIGGVYQRSETIYW